MRFFLKIMFLIMFLHFCSTEEFMMYLNGKLLDKQYATRTDYTKYSVEIDGKNSIFKINKYAVFAPVTVFKYKIKIFEFTNLQGTVIQSIPESSTSENSDSFLHIRNIGSDLSKSITPNLTQNQIVYSYEEIKEQDIFEINIIKRNNKENRWKVSHLVFTKNDILLVDIIKNVDNSVNICSILSLKFILTEGQMIQDTSKNTFTITGKQIVYVEFTSPPSEIITRLQYVLYKNGIKIKAIYISYTSTNKTKRKRLLK